MVRASHPNQIIHGFTLVEVLISILIVAIGFAGAIKLQTAAMQAIQQSIYIGDAGLLAAEMSDRMMGNTEMLTRVADNPYLKVNFRAGLNQIAPASSCYQNRCNSDQLAAADIAEWLHTINAALPDVRAVICRDDSAWNYSADNFAWDCHSGSDHSGIVIKLGWTDKNDLQHSAPPRLVIPAYAYQE